jgi:guanylate kinase
MSNRARSEEPRAIDEQIPSIFVICGPSGCGKSTLISRLMSDFPGRFGFSVSHTTRQPRAGEINGVHYNFTTNEKIEAEINAGLFLEHALVHGNHYGTSFAAIDSVTNTGKICILDIDIQGVENVKKSDKVDQSKVVYAMLVPPSIEELERRLRGRQTDSDEVIVRRIARAREEMEYAKKTNEFWDAILVNDNIDNCYDSLVELVGRKFQLVSPVGSPKGSKLFTLSARKPAAPSNSDLIDS